jgi:hypothetical protein
MTFSLEKSFLTFSLNKDYLFISAYPGFVVFGEVKSNHYETFKYFHLSHNQLLVFYENIVKIVCFLSNETLSEDQNIICKTNDNLTYLWRGTQEIFDNTIVKIIKLCIEMDSNNIIFEISMSSSQFNHLLSTLSRMIIASLCFKPKEKYIFKRAVSASVDQILSFQIYQKCKDFVIEVFKKESSIYEISLMAIENLIDLLMHYNATLLVLHKIETLLTDKTQENLKFILTCN